MCAIHLSYFLAPNAPSQVTAVVRNCRTIRVSWDAVSFNGTQLDTYTVFYKENSSDSMQMVMVNGLEKLLTDLEPLTVYRIRVAAVNGTVSPEIQNTTFGGQ